MPNFVAQLKLQIMMKIFRLISSLPASWLGGAVRRVAVTMLLLCVTTVAAWAAKMYSWAIWSPEDNTLYFVRSSTDYATDNSYKGHSISAWEIADKNDTKQPIGSNTARWITFSGVAKNCKRVVFDGSFSEARPIDCSK